MTGRSSHAKVESKIEETGRSSCGAIGIKIEWRISRVESNAKPRLGLIDRKEKGRYPRREDTPIADRIGPCHTCDRANTSDLIPPPMESVLTAQSEPARRAMEALSKRYEQY
ncbi:hypothetical protein PGTUg99_015019 [Puccinia graminis f. sp. tritici]|uniref:Uncharacterized protein n=1 Tax=Puccinia graminis f. sp. tritici TaxID=56615 RepID=A0A5B0RIU8_PUCGR|nr:hypothetical protein PGTUg99_015019 [Puccinia graminis f. sp. tritici]